MAEGVWITEQDVVGLIDLGTAMDAVRDALAQEARGTAQTMAKTAVSWSGGHTLHALGGIVLDDALAGAKTWTHAAGGAEPLMVLWHAKSGALVAVIEAFALGQLRTSSMSAIAIHELSDPATATMAIIGSGRQSLAQVAAAVASRPIEQVRIFSPTRANRETFGERLRDMWAGEVVVCDQVGQAVDGAGVVTLATRSREPVLASSMLRPDVLVNALGAITPERAELPADLVAGASLVVADSPAVARQLSAELAGADTIVPLCNVVSGATTPPAGGVCIFKAMGLGLADVAVAGAIVRAAQSAGVGRTIPARRAAAPQLFPQKGTS